MTPRERYLNLGLPAECWDLFLTYCERRRIDVHKTLDGFERVKQRMPGAIESAAQQLRNVWLKAGVSKN